MCALEHSVASNFLSFSQLTSNTVSKIEDGLKSVIKYKASPGTVTNLSLD